MTRLIPGARRVIEKLLNAENVFLLFRLLVVGGPDGEKFNFDFPFLKWLLFWASRGGRNAGRSDSMLFTAVLFCVVNG
jgi:hypothetical protein